jgi:hypothetical protein
MSEGWKDWAARAQLARRRPWQGQLFERDAAPAFYARTCVQCGEQFALDPTEWHTPPGPKETWRCSGCRQQPRRLRNLFRLFSGKA